LNQLNDDFARTPEEAKKKIEAALPSTAESHRFENNIEFYSTAASDGRGFDWIKQQLKPAEGLPTNAASKKPAAWSSTKVYEERRPRLSKVENQIDANKRVADFLKAHVPPADCSCKGISARVGTTSSV